MTASGVGNAVIQIMSPDERERLAVLEQKFEHLEVDVQRMAGKVDDMHAVLMAARGVRWAVITMAGIVGFIGGVIAALVHWRNLTGAVLILACLTAVAMGHAFYPRECCSGIDCAPLDASRVKVTPDGYVIDGRETVPYNKVRWSPDEHYHGCFPASLMGRVGCFWAPQRGM